MSADGTRLLVRGWGAATEDSLGIVVVPTAGGEPIRWFTAFAEQGDAVWLADGSLLVSIWLTTESVSLFKVRGPGQVERLGTIPRPVRQMTVSKNLARATVFNREYRGDAWL